MKDHHFYYIRDLTRYERQKTWKVNIGGVFVGGDNPVRIQSMTDTLTMDTEATVEQVIALARAGADYVRITVKGKNDVQNLKNISEMLRERGFEIPLIADIHFNPKLAEMAAKYVDKVRINPGNFYDKMATFQSRIFSDEEYKEELQKIEKQFIPFLEVLKKTNTAL